MIESRNNKIVKLIQQLSEKKYREKEKLFLAEGIRFVREIPLDWSIEFYAVSSSFLKKTPDFLYHKNVQVLELSDSLFSAISHTKNPQGILAVCKQKNYSLEELLKKNPKTAFYVIADEMNDPGNLGTVIRTADACKADGVFLTKDSVDLYNDKVLRSTMGSLFHLPIVQGLEIEQISHLLKKYHISIYAAHLKATQYPYQFDFKNSCAILIGNEARGLSDSTIAFADSYIKIPMPGQAESLNASVAAGVLMYEVVRQRLE